MKRRDAFPGSFISKEDAAMPVVATIAQVRQEELIDASGATYKPVIYFYEGKPLILNRVNWMAIEEAYGDESDDWVGKPIELYCDPDVTFDGNRVGGIRVRIPLSTPLTKGDRGDSFIIRDAHAWNELRAWAVAQAFVDDDAKAGFRLQNVLRDAGWRDFPSGAASIESAKALVAAHYGTEG